MPYDMEKYRDKRERVLGKKRRFPTVRHLSMLFAITVITVVSIKVIPQAIAYFQDRHLADAIYRKVDNQAWDEHLVRQVEALEGVKQVAVDTRTNRMVVTFDAMTVPTEKLNAAISVQQGAKPVLLNVLGHRQRMHTMAEEAAFETL